MRYMTEFPKFGELDLVLPEGFIDESSNERAMPTFVYELGNGNLLRLWIDYKDKALSKFPNQERFCLSVYSKDKKRLHDDIRNDNWLQTQIIIRGLQEFHSLHGANRD